MSCPYTFQQNSKAEHALCTINNIVRSLLFQGSLLPVYWADSLHTASYLLNCHPTMTLGGLTPFFALFGTYPSYTHLRILGCACYPNLSSTAPHKLSPHSSLCIFLGYSSITRVTDVSISIPTESSSPTTWCLMNPHFLSPRCPPHPQIPPP